MSAMLDEPGLDQSDPGSGPELDTDLDDPALDDRGEEDEPIPILDLTEVRKTYAMGAIEVEALRGVDLVVPEGDYVAIMGPSGSGKSTLMHILGALDVPTSGIYRLAGVDVGSMDEDDLADVRNRRIGFVFQQFNLLATLTAWRNVELPLVYAGVPRKERRRRAVAALERVGLGDRVDHKPTELSGGQQQRVSVARALVTDPDLILADEPTGNLDSTSTRDVLSLFHELHEQGRTVVLITHEREVAAEAARVVFIRDGHLYHSHEEEAAATAALGEHAGAQAPPPEHEAHGATETTRIPLWSHEEPGERDGFDELDEADPPESGEPEDPDDPGKKESQ